MTALAHKQHTQLLLLLLGSVCQLTYGCLMPEERFTDVSPADQHAVHMLATVLLHRARHGIML